MLVIQIYVIVYTNLFVACWHVYSWPMTDRLNNFIYFFNEGVLLLFSYYIFLFSDYSLTAERKYSFGYLYLGVLALSFFVNFFTIGVMYYLSVKKWLHLKKERKAYQELQLTKVHVEQVAEQAEQEAKK